MTCEEARLLFDEKIDGAISESDAAKLSAHIAECESCRRELADLEKTHALLSSFAIDTPAELSETAMARIQREKKRQTVYKKWIRPLVAIPAAALLCVALLHSPLFDAMMPAKAADMSITADHKNNMYSDITGGLGFKADADEVCDAPEELAPLYAPTPIADTPFTLLFLDAENALLIREENGQRESLAVTYSTFDNTVTIEKDGKKVALLLTGDTFTLTNGNPSDLFGQ
jgi:hypothetical protein